MRRAHELLEQPTAGRPTGLAELDRRLGGGLPAGAVVELTGPLSSGKTSLAWRIVAETARRGELVAYIDPYGTLDGESAQAAGVLLDRLLWIHWPVVPDAADSAPSAPGQAASSDAPAVLERALKCADVAARSGVFALVVLDLQPPPEQRPRQWPPAVWFRLQRAVQGTETTLLVLSPVRLAGSAARLALTLQRRESWWRHGASRHSSPRFEPEADSPPEIPAPPGNRLQGWEARASVWKGSHRDVVPIHCRF
ncbi:MAG: hypothetical protein Kow00109_14220 [Acidobacteriota bacterium]